MTAGDRHVILSLGAGVQSTTLALMALRGDLPSDFDPPIAAVFADTGFEPRRVYEHLHWLLGTLGSELPLHIVRAVRPDGTLANIREDSEAIVRGTLPRLANPPVFVKESVEYTPYRDADQQARFEAYLVQRGEIPRFVTMPLFARAFTGAKPVMLRRQCTGDYKVEPIYRHTRPLIGRRRGQRHNTPPFAEMWIGISAEESARRCKPSREGWVTNRYPLRELGMTRADCERWLWDNYQRVVPKSACLGCLAYETEVLTPEGSRPIGALAGRATLLIPNAQRPWGMWQVVEVRSFGVQPLDRLTLARRGLTKTVYATPEHRWLTRGRNRRWRPFVITRELVHGDALPICLPRRLAPRSDWNEDWTVVSVEPTGRLEEVFCAVVPGRELFTLADNLVTGNCPYHDDDYWRALQTESPDEFDEACRFDDTIRNLPGVKGECFVHSSCVPLREIDFSRTRAERRALTRGQGLLFDAGEGVCSL